MSIKNESELRVWRSECRRRRKSRVSPGAFINKVKATEGRRCLDGEEGENHRQETIKKWIKDKV